jgi:hypothetical protein
MTKSTRVAFAAALLAVALVIAGQWLTHSERSPTKINAAMRRGPAVAPTAARGATGANTDAQAPIEPLSTTSPTIDAPVETSQGSPPAEPDIPALAEGADPLLRQRNLITRSGDAEQNGPAFADLESRFSTEDVDASWSGAMEAQILAQISQVAGLALVTLNAECRRTICRVKLFYPPGTNALSSLDKLRPVAAQIGFAHVVQVATLGDDGTPISLLYFQRRDVGDDRAAGAR